MPSTLVSGCLCFPHNHMGGSPIPACVLLSHYRCEGDLTVGLCYNSRKSFLFCTTHTCTLIPSFTHGYMRTHLPSHMYTYTCLHTCILIIHAHTFQNHLQIQMYVHVNIHAQIYTGIYAHTIAAFTKFTGTQK